jgi:hypothetical protein
MEQDPTLNPDDEIEVPAVAATEEPQVCGSCGFFRRLFYRATYYELGPRGAYPQR